ncbi:MAG: UDP-N-acetylmuramoylalanyl-D-glutamyl-2,6-diaminopimelate--D-alanyl-D-alanine ligase [Propylenella sp.]
MAAAGGRLAGGAPSGVAGVSIDSRTIGPGEAFVAIHGPNRDGHEFVGAALKAGAALAVVQDGRAKSNVGPLLVVPDDPLAALERIGAAARDRMRGSVVAVTGSVGKTGTKEMLRLALSSLGPTHAPVGSFNNQWGVPLTLARMPVETRFGVFEIGMNHPGEIRPLTKQVRPHVAVVTTVAPVHLAFFDSEAAIAEAKAEIFEGLEHDGVAVLNRDNQWFDLLSKRAVAQGARIVSFGEHASADVRLNHTALGADGAEIEALVAREPIAYRLGAPGRHLVQNSLAVLAAAHALGADIARMAPALAAFRAPKGRGERLRLRHTSGPFTLIDESYNANPASMRAALALLGQTKPEGQGRRIAVLGDMRELGDAGPALHRGLLPAVEEAHADTVFLAGPLMEGLWRDLPESRRGAYAASAAELPPILLEAVGPGDVVMVKASLGTELGPVVEALKRRFAGGAE